jgi:L-amino acid N-acyltransferase YncA
VLLRDARDDDAAAIAALYNPYIVGTTISFEEQPVTAAGMAQRIADVRAAGLPWLVTEEHGELSGYAYATKWRVRHAYRFSVESTVYVKQGLAGQGIGSALYSALLERLTDAGIHLVIGGIALPNDASIALHEKLGFEKVAQFKEVGYKLGAWRDVGYWQKKLDSRPGA